MKKLSKQEYKVCKLIEKGYKNKKIAEMLELSEKTISTYIARIYRKIKLSSENNVIILIQTLNKYFLLEERKEATDGDN